MAVNNPENIDMGENRYNIVLGAPFKPFKGAREFYFPPEGKKPFYIGEDYTYHLYLRRWVNLQGIDGCIDVISEDPKSFIRKMAVMAAGYRYFSDEPLGETNKTTYYSGNGVYTPEEESAILRFSFILNTPEEYSRLLSTYGEAKLGRERFLLTLALNERKVSEGFDVLRSGRKLLVVEKNIFNLKEVEKMEKLAWLDTVDEKVEGEVPERVAFVEFPVDLKKFRTIKLTFSTDPSGGERKGIGEPIPFERIKPMLLRAA